MNRLVAAIGLVMGFSTVGCTGQSASSTEQDPMESVSSSHLVVTTSMMPATSTPIRLVNLVQHWMVSGGGNIQADPPVLSCGATKNGIASCTIPDGITVRLTAEPIDGYQFLGWGGACSAAGAGKVCSLTIDGDTSIDVTFR